jgi:c-di-GMP-binding flagellar brake protein YcgR
MRGGYPNKRRFPRVPSEHAVLVKKLAPEVHEDFARTRVMGLGGCMFVSSEPLGVGSPVEILISVKDQVIKAQARVVWENPTEAGTVEIGVEFLHISPEDRAAIERLFPPA